MYFKNVNIRNTELHVCSFHRKLEMERRALEVRTIVDRSALIAFVDELHNRRRLQIADLL